MDLINLDNLNRKHAFYQGAKSEISQVEVNTSILKQKKLKPEVFGKVGDVLPIELVDCDEESKDDAINMSCFNDISGPPVWTQEGKKQALMRF